MILIPKLFLVLFPLFPFLSGFLEPPGNPSSLADLESRINSVLITQTKLQNELENAQQRMDTLARQLEILQEKDLNIAFFAYLRTDLVDPLSNSKVIFDEVETNAGGAYDPMTGVFVAPLKGSYHFHFIGSAPENSDLGHIMHIYIMKNGQREGYAFLDRNTDHWIQSSTATVLHLRQGDKVWVQIAEVVGQHLLAGHRTSDNATHTHFSGFLIAAD